jgi:3-oxoacyl-[acyl-carrier protein] reductase|tara:strand:+ start:140 stop:910 length:771 start_codon:yes stop_codon:yes gene_type:complete
MTLTEKRVALVTGASTGIGRAEAIALAKADYNVAINYARSTLEAEKTASLCSDVGVDTLLIQADVAEEAEVVRMIDEVKARFQRLDVLCNNAGTTTTGLAWQFEQIAVEDWDRVFNVNVRGVFLVTKHAAPLLKASDDACIVNTNSIVGARPGPQALPYSVSKGALWTMTKALAGALGRSGVRVNGVAPGWMEGDWMQRMLGENYDKLMGARAKQTPLQRVVNAQDVAQAAMSLIDGNKSVSGQILVVDGGFSSVT